MGNSINSSIGDNLKYASFLLSPLPLKGKRIFKKNAEVEQKIIEMVIIKKINLNQKNIQKQKKDYS